MGLGWSMVCDSLTLACRFILIVVGVIVFIPVVGLAGFHVGLVCMGRTTNEHVSSASEVSFSNV